MEIVYLTLTSEQLTTILVALDRDIDYVSDNTLLTASEAEVAIDRLRTVARVLIEQANTTDERS